MSETEQGTTVPTLTAPGYTERVDLAAGRAVLFYPDGTVRFEHPCHLPRSDIDAITAPALQIGHGHTVIQRDPLTIVASILCGDCGEHGWVTDGRWVAA